MVLIGGLISTESAAKTDVTTLDRNDTLAIQQVIRDQVMAFRQDDEDAAFSFAAPGIREKYETAETFMHVVRDHYLPIYRPDVFEFGDLVPTRSGLWIQNVFVVGPSGSAHVALYFMERQDDGEWRIAGCVLNQLEGEPA